jgi:ubiquinone/menaquinone biosynthesis C-methylase UbiE
MSAIRKTIVAQFRRPTGPLGILAGHIMATRPSNRKRNGWTVDLLDPGPGEALLEIGCGPGLALELTAKRAPGVELTGLDHSTVMLAQARRRLHGDTSVAFASGGLDTISGWPSRFDGIYSVNVAQFFEDIDAAYELICQALKPGGRVVTTYQPRHRNPTADDARRMATRISDAMSSAGFAGTGVHELSLEPVMAIAVTGERPR